MPLLMNLAVATIDPGGRPPAEGVEGVSSVSFCLLVPGPPFGLLTVLTSAERSGRVMLCSAGPLEEEPWYCSHSARRSARLSWVTSGAGQIVRRGAANGGRFEAGQGGSAHPEARR